MDGHLEQTCVTVPGRPFDGPIQDESDQINPANSTYFSQQWELAVRTNPRFII